MGECSLLVSRAEGNSNSLLVQQISALGIRHQGAHAARCIKEAWVDLTMTRQAREYPGSLVQWIGQDLQDLNAWHVPAFLDSLRNLHPINPAAKAAAYVVANCAEEPVAVSLRHSTQAVMPVCELHLTSIESKASKRLQAV